MQGGGDLLMNFLETAATAGNAVSMLILVTWPLALERRFKPAPTLLVLEALWPIHP